VVRLERQWRGVSTSKKLGVEIGGVGGGGEGGFRDFGVTNCRGGTPLQAVVGTVTEETNDYFATR
jgi:hypothetical protein